LKEADGRPTSVGVTGRVAQEYWVPALSLS
jgi:hypothetical protein